MSSEVSSVYGNAFGLQEKFSDRVFFFVRVVVCFLCCAPPFVDSLFPLWIHTATRIDVALGYSILTCWTRCWDDSITYLQM